MPESGNNQQRPNPFQLFGPGMRMMLLLSLCFSCWGIFQVMAGSAVFSWLTAGPDDGVPVLYARLSDALFGVVIFALPAIIFANVFPPERFRWFRMNVRVKPVLLLLGALVMLTAIVGSWKLNEWGNSLISDASIRQYIDAMNKNTAWVLSMPTAGDLIICLLLNALVPALCEELFFRASLQQLAMHWLKRPHAAIWLVAAIFSFLHFDPAGFAVRLLLGAALGYLFYWSGSLWVSIFAHFIFNAADIVNAFLGDRFPAVAAWEPGIVISIASYALAILFLVLARKAAKKPSLL